MIPSEHLAHYQVITSKSLADISAHAQVEMILIAQLMRERKKQWRSYYLPRSCSDNIKEDGVILCVSSKKE